jgi:hypothetical protein
VRKLESVCRKVIGRYYEWSIIYQRAFYNLSGQKDGTSHLPFTLSKNTKTETLCLGFVIKIFLKVK